MNHLQCELIRLAIQFQDIPYSEEDIEYIANQLHRDLPGMGKMLYVGYDKKTPLNKATIKFEASPYYEEGIPRVYYIYFTGRGDIEINVGPKNARWGNVVKTISFNDNVRQTYANISKVVEDDLDKEKRWDKWDKRHGLISSDQRRTAKKGNTYSEKLFDEIKAKSKEYNKKAAEAAIKQVAQHINGYLSKHGFKVKSIDAKVGNFRGHNYMSTCKVIVAVGSDSNAKAVLGELVSKYSPKFKLKSFENGVAEYNVR